MQLLDWVVVATVGAIVLVLLDGFRRKWRDRRNRVVMKLERNIPQDVIDPDEFPNSELPNGGARTLIRDTDPPPGSPLQRKRNYNLKDGRDRVRSGDPEPANVPVLMDPVQIEETDIEHANVFVTAETNRGFANEELPPEVLSGLDDDTLTDNAGDQFVPVSSDPLMAGMPDEPADDYAHLHDDEPEPARADDRITNQADDVEHEQAEAADELIDGLDEDYMDDHEHGSAATGEHGSDGHDSEAIEQEDDEQEDEEQEYDPTQDEHYYENEPALLENAYKLATSTFQRQPKETPAPRIEPGFGDQPEHMEPEESGENFGAIIDESVMTEFLEGEQEEIRAWRTQSATRQTVPEPPAPATAPDHPAPEAAKPVPQVTAIHMEPRVINIQANPQTNAQAKVHSNVQSESQHHPQTDVHDEPEPLMHPEPVKTAPPAAPRETKPGFWQSVTGKSSKPARTEPPKIDQGELFRDDEQHEEAALESGPQEVIIVNVMAQSGAVFHGADLMPVLQHYGMRLGSMSIFHRHTEVDGSGPIMFSMANMVKPGTFSLSEMDTYVTPGLSFFVQLPNRHGNMKAFELMLATANGVKQALDGVLKDERRSVLTRQTVEHCRQRIRDFELSLLRKK